MQNQPQASPSLADDCLRRGPNPHVGKARLLPPPQAGRTFNPSTGVDEEKEEVEIQHLADRAVDGQTALSEATGNLT